MKTSCLNGITIVYLYNKTIPIMKKQILNCLLISTSAVLVSSCSSLKISKNSSNFDDAYITSSDLKTDPFYAQTKAVPAPASNYNNTNTPVTSNAKTYGRTYSDRFNNFGSSRFCNVTPMSYNSIVYTSRGMVFCSFLPYNNAFNNGNYYYPSYYGNNFGFDNFGYGYNNYGNFYNPYGYNPYGMNGFGMNGFGFYSNPWYYCPNNWNSGNSSGGNSSNFWSSRLKNSNTSTGNNVGRRISPNTGMGSSQTNSRSSSYNSGYSSGSSSSGGGTYRSNASGSGGSTSGSSGDVIRQNASSGSSGSSSTTTHSGSTNRRR